MLCGSWSEGGGELNVDDVAVLIRLLFRYHLKLVKNIHISSSKFLPMDVIRCSSTWSVHASTKSQRVRETVRKRYTENQPIPAEFAPRVVSLSEDLADGSDVSARYKVQQR